MDNTMKMNADGSITMKARSTREVILKVFFSLVAIIGIVLIAVFIYGDSHQIDIHGIFLPAFYMILVVFGSMFLYKGADDLVSKIEDIKKQKNKQIGPRIR